MTLEMAKLTLLTHSKNMLKASEEEAWDQFSALESGWRNLLEKAIKEHGPKLNQISSELMLDNQQIQNNIQSAQQALLNSFEKSTNGVSSVKSYLK